jgi:DNA-binding phage protein
MTIKPEPWDVVKHLDSPEAIAGYIIAAFEDGDPELIAVVIGDVARAMSRLLDESERAR